MRAVFMALIAGAGILLPLASVSAQNNTDTGAQLEVECEYATDDCYAYLLGVWDGMLGLANLANTNLICPGGAVNAEQLRLVFSKFATEHPEFLSRDRGYVAMAAYMSAFPCSSE